MSDFDIQFGDMEEATPEVHLRPEKNKHYACVAYGQPNSHDLPIYVDIDVQRDMEEHALADTSVELGGVLLGGQYEDEAGQPFVVVTDSLRAEHYESTKGSFKFTHETWEKITRQREEFPDDLQMVGWYHTHPDWGVFLSGMDMFICDNFFNRPLDVALVIDPCRQDRGMFMWTGDPHERVRRTDGFYLIGSRFRDQELRNYSAQLESEYTMADPRYSNMPGSFGAPVVNVTREANHWQTIAVLGMLAMQFLLVAFLFWRTMEPVPVADAEPSQEDRQQLKQIAADLELRAKVVAREEAFLNQFYATDDPATGVQLVTENSQLKQQNLDLRNTVTGLSAKVDLDQQALTRLNDSLDQSRADYANATERLLGTQKQLEEQSGEIKLLKERISNLSGEGQENQAGAEGAQLLGVSLWIWVSGGVAVVVGAIAATLWTAQRNDPQEEHEEAQVQESDSDSD
ncbi:MAG TPA: hypothetical protein DCY79_13440 [Planctomycetaceae bacterium]|nr:hypothetical protein [Blastopirellula sp.]HAY80805.1 hypothetical protein [Planctomycetaceae bacterium]